MEENDKLYQQIVKKLGYEPKFPFDFGYAFVTGDNKVNCPLKLLTAEEFHYLVEKSKEG